MKSEDYLIDEERLSLRDQGGGITIYDGSYTVILYPWEMDKIAAAWITYRRDEEDTDVIKSKQFKRLVKAMYDFFYGNPELVKDTGSSEGDDGPVVNEGKGNCKSTAPPVDLDKVIKAIEETCEYYGGHEHLKEHIRAAYLIKKFIENYVNAIK